MTEYNFDGLVGPSHNYAGLSPGNVASTNNESALSNPKAAALQGIGKMGFAASLGLAQGVLPPHCRPHLPFLRSIGFSGSDEEVLQKAGKNGGHLLRTASSASSMWTANAATIAPSNDTADGRMHVVPANLQEMTHRAIEAEQTTKTLRAIFNNNARFCVHDPLPHLAAFADEGAANHSRLVGEQGKAVHLFAFGRSHQQSEFPAPKRFPARQTLESTLALERLLQLKNAPSSVVIRAHQSPKGIDDGSFHTDVLAVANRNVLLVHEHAFSDLDTLVNSARQHIPNLKVCVARESELSVKDAVASYPFNSQLVSLPDGSMAIIAPMEAKENPRAHDYLQRAVSEVEEIKKVHFLDVKQSMRNGGGPACLRLRVVLTSDEAAAVSQGVILAAPGADDAGFTRLETWVHKHYRDRLSGEDLSDPMFYREQCTALDELTSLLGLGSIYPFQ